MAKSKKMAAKETLTRAQFMAVLESCMNWDIETYTADVRHQPVDTEDGYLKEGPRRVTFTLTEKGFIEE